MQDLEILEPDWRDLLDRWAGEPPVPFAPQEPEKLERMRRKLSGAQLSKDKDIVGYRAGIGVVNVNNRIRLTYGEEYGVTIDSSPGQGTVVTLRMRAEEFGNVWKETVIFQGPFDMN